MPFCPFVKLETTIIPTVGTFWMAKVSVASGERIRSLRELTGPRGVVRTIHKNLAIVRWPLVGPRDARQQWLFADSVGGECRSGV